MSMSEVRASIRRYWTISVVVLVLTPVVMGVYLAGRDVIRPPASFTTSADVLIPARADDFEEPEDVPPVLLQGQIELAHAPETRAQALERADLDPADVGDLDLRGELNDSRTIMTLSVEARTPALAETALEGYIFAYEYGRRESVRAESRRLRDVNAATVRILSQRLDEVLGLLDDREIPLPFVVEDGERIALPLGVTDGDRVVLFLYERNSLINERHRRLVAFGLNAVAVQIPSQFSTVVQRRTTARITPPPPSPLIPLLQMAGVGLLLAVALPVARDRLDGSITEPKGALNALRTGLLATIPTVPRRLQRSIVPPGSEWDLAFRSLAATSISTDRLQKAVVVTSPAGTTQDFVAANFAAGLASMGVTVALIGTVPRQDWYLHDRDPEAEDADDAEASARVVAPGAPRVPTPPTFPELLEDARAGRLVGDLRPRLGRRDREHLYIIPPGEEPELTLDGLPPLLDALSTSGIDVTVIAGPALLPDPNATIIAWSTRHVLWAVELGQVERSDAQLAAERLELAGVEPFGIALVKRRVIRH